jgi:hypothetical protein
MPAIFPTNRPPKHLSDLPLISYLYVIFKIELLFPDLIYNIKLYMSPRLCLSLVALKDLILLLVCLILILFCLFKPFPSILFRK